MSDRVHIDIKVPGKASVKLSVKVSPHLPIPEILRLAAENVPGSLPTPHELQRRYKVCKDERARCELVRDLMEAYKRNGKAAKDLADDLGIKSPRLSQLKTGYFLRRHR